MRARNISSDGGVNGDLQVVRELDTLRKILFGKNGTQRIRNGSNNYQNDAKMSRKGTHNDQSVAKNVPKSNPNEEGKGNQRVTKYIFK